MGEVVKGGNGMSITKASWINRPEKFSITDEGMRLSTEPHTDFWQRSYYGFRNDNAPALLWDVRENFTLTAFTEFAYKKQFDQAGLIVYLDCDNWFKASIEFETDDHSRLGSVVTNLGYSDWATQDIKTRESLYYRLSRRGPDFRVEYSLDGVEYLQMRIFHLHTLGPTTEAMGKEEDPLPEGGNPPVKVGFYACSPGDSSFTAGFSQITWGDNLWRAHHG
jgi:regulation of enolase protein 1 (concanavalin A-like superfamily)